MRKNSAKNNILSANYLNGKQIDNICNVLTDRYAEKKLGEGTIIRQIDIEDFATTMLGCKIMYETIDEDVDCLGFLSDGIVPLPVIRNGQAVKVLFPKDTIVIDKYLNMPTQLNRKRFTIAHEAGHLIKKRMYNISGPEYSHEGGLLIDTVSELSKWLLLDFLKRGYKKDALKRMLQILRAVFTFGMRRQICFENPAADILLEDYAQFCNLESKANEERSFSEEEIEKLRSYCLADNKNPHAAIMLVAMETGMRVGELTALKKEDIDDGYISVHRQQIQVPKTETNSKAFYKEVNYTKNERVNPRGGRIIPITKNCQIALDIANNLAGDSEYVFHHPDGRPVLKQSYMYYLRRRCKDLGIGISNNHAFRVAFNARLIEAGVDGNERCLVLGHSMQTNERHYSFSDKRRINDVKNKLSGLKNVL